MPLEIQIQQNIGGPNPGAVTVKLSGSLDTATAPELLRRLSPVLASPVKDLVFDLAQLKLITSAGWGVFRVASKELPKRGGQVALVNVPPQIQEAIDIMSSPIGPIFTSLAELDAYLVARQRSYEESK
jgi:anti-anti-sigma factor